MLTEIARCFYLNRKNKKNHEFKPKGCFDTIKRDYRVKLTDIDFNMHINNACYLTYMERSRWDHAIHTNLWDTFVSQKVKLLVAGLELSYFGEIKLFSRFHIETTIAGFDHKYLYIEQKFYCKGKLCTYALVKMAAVKNRKVLSPEEFFKLCGEPVVSTPLPDVISQWNKVAEAKKAQAKASS